jgi:hypothetical protein
MMKFTFAALAAAVLLSTASFGAEYRVQRVRTIGGLRNPVIFQSTDLRKVRGTNLLAGTLVARWGTNVFEVARAFYACDRRNRCNFERYERLGMFDRCTVKGPRRIECRGRRIDRSGDAGAPEIIIHDHPDSTDEWHRDPRNDEDEFPTRVDGEFDDIF